MASQFSSWHLLEQRPKVGITTVDSSLVMTAEARVDAALKGLDLQEPTTFPTVGICSYLELLKQQQAR